MNLSLIVTIILIAIIIPWLWRRLFIQPATLTTWLEPTSAIAEHTTLSQQAHIMRQESILSDPIAILPTQKISLQRPQQRQIDLLSQSHYQTLRINACPPQLFIGYDLLQALQNAGFEYGADALFHYYADDESDTVLFSIASTKPPGTFDMQRIGAFSTTSLILFIDTMQVSNIEEVYTHMSQVAEELAEELGGEILSL
jgi:FtsZ-interacting cell division protein ZipA